MLRSLLIVFLLLPAAAAPAQVQTPAADSLTTHLQALAAQSQLPGFAVAVVDSGGVRYEHGFGLADRATKTAFTARTVQKVGSVSKTLIGVCLLKGVELGYFTLDTPINKVLPWPVKNPYQPTATIRIRDLATHTSGIIDDEKAYQRTYIFGEGGSELRFDGAAPANQQSRGVLRAFLKNYFTVGTKRHFAATRPGAEYSYSNIGAALAAYLLEVKSGLSYADFARRYVLQPAGMTASGWSFAEVKGQPLATGYRPTGQPYQTYLSVTYPDGGLHTSAHDLALYLRQVLRGAAGRPGLLTADAFRTMLAPQFPAEGLPKSRPRREPNCGIFWAIRADSTIGHLGSDPGVFAAMFFDPKTGIGKIFLTNVDFDDQPALAQQFAAIWKALGAWEKRL